MIGHIRHHILAAIQSNDLYIIQNNAQTIFLAFNKQSLFLSNQQVLSIKTNTLNTSIIFNIHKLHEYLVVIPKRLLLN